MCLVCRLFNEFQFIKKEECKLEVLDAYRIYKIFYLFLFSLTRVFFFMCFFLAKKVKSSFKKQQEYN